MGAGFKGSQGVGLAGFGQGERQLARGVVGEGGGETGHGDLDRMCSGFVLTGFRLGGGGCTSWLAMLGGPTNANLCVL